MADRFLRRPGKTWLDMATGELVRLRVRRASDLAEERAWLDRLTSLSSLWHPHVLTPLDFGALGRGRCFEAWPIVEPVARRSRGLYASAVRSTIEFLDSQGLMVGEVDWRRIVLWRGQVVLAPDRFTGLERAAKPERAAGDLAAWLALLKRSRSPRHSRASGARLQAPPELRWVTDVLAHASGGEVRVVTVPALCGADARTFIRVVARAARMGGYVPVDVAVAGRHLNVLAVLRGRHVLLIDRAVAAASFGAVLLSPAVRAAHATVLLRMAAPSGERAKATRSKDAREDGSTWRAPKPHGEGPWRVHETSLAYGEVDSPPSHTSVQELPAAQPSERAPLPREETDAASDRRVATAVAQLNRARELAGSGRHAAAERTWRTAIGVLDRRGVAEASEGRIGLAGMLAGRGRTRDAIAVLQEEGSSPEVRRGARMAIALSSVLTEEAQLSAAERAARTAAIVAAREGTSGQTVDAALALARCLFWQGRFDDAANVLASVAPADALQAVRVDARMARIELARCRFTEAGRAASRAVTAACEASDAAVRACAQGALAAVLAAVGDGAGFRSHGEQALAEARRSRAPLLGLKLRLLMADGYLLLGMERDARAACGRLARWPGRTLTPLLRGRLRCVLGRLGDAGARAAGERFVRTTGAHGALAIGREDPAMDSLQDLSDVLHICHESPDEMMGLGRACESLRTRMRALAVGIVAGGSDVPPLVGAGASWREPSQAAERAASAGLPIRPFVTSAGLEAAAPVRYGGLTIGALMARWPVDAQLDVTRVMGILSASAMAGAPWVRTALDRLATPRVTQTGPQPQLLGASAAIETVRAAVARAARAPFALLIEGESGCGKELVARAVHAQSDRRVRRLCAVNCAAFSDDLLESELFGHARGAFTGALAERPGLFEDADGGTLLLDEVCELSARAQAKLLRVLQEGEIRRVGENLPRRVDVRLIAATNRPLQQEVERGRFRADLRYRLDVIRIVVPPLRERVDDIPVLAGHFWEQAARRTGSRATLAPDMLAALARYDWPGNVRELQNVMTSLAVQTGARGRVGAAALPDHVARAVDGGPPMSLGDARAAFERRFVRAVLAQSGGRRAEAARALGVSRQGLAKLLRRLNIDCGQPESWREPIAVR